MIDAWQSDIDFSHLGVMHVTLQLFLIQSIFFGELMRQHYAASSGLMRRRVLSVAVALAIGAASHAYLSGTSWGHAAALAALATVTTWLLQRPAPRPWSRVRCTGLDVGDTNCVTGWNSAGEAYILFGGAVRRVKLLDGEPAAGEFVIRATEQGRYLVGQTDASASQCGARRYSA